MRGGRASTTDSLNGDRDRLGLAESGVGVRLIRTLPVSTEGVAGARVSLRGGARLCPGREVSKQYLFMPLRIQRWKTYPPKYPEKPAASG
jgi:hypothetical protein